MLFAVEGGGFFSSSASGYSEGLTLLLRGQRGEDKPMRVSLWNYCHSVERESDLSLQLASAKNQLRGCASLVCFGRTSAGLDAPPLQVGPAKERDAPPENVVPDVHKGHTSSTDDDEISRKAGPRSSLKKQSENNSDSGYCTKESEASGENGYVIQGHAGRRKVQWTDACGIELVEIREFEPSEVGGSDNEYVNGNEKSCSCAIM